MSATVVARARWPDVAGVPGLRGRWPTAAWTPRPGGIGGPRERATVVGAAATPPFTGRPPATGSAWPTPTCSSRSPRDRGPGRGGDEVGLRRRQGDPRVDGPGPGDPGRGRARPGHHRGLILDHWGVVKADIGVRDGRIVAIGKAGNPDIMDGVTPASRSGPPTEIIAGNGKILTAGAIDCHVHLICPQIARGGARLRGDDDHRRRHRAGRGDAGDHRTPGRLEPGPDARGARRMAGQLRSAGQGEHRFRRRRCGNSCGPARRVQAARGLGLDARPRSTPACGSATPPACRPPCTPTRSTRPASSRPRSRRSPGRTIHAYHTEGAGGGHAPDIITVAGEPTSCPRRPTRPVRTRSTRSTSTSTC